jgi:hypothetical protein
VVGIPRLRRPITTAIGTKYALSGPAKSIGVALEWNVAFWHNVRAQLGPFEGTETAALPTLGINGRFTVYGARLEPMSALAKSTFDRAGAANGRSPPIVSNAALFTKVAFGLEAEVRCGIHQCHLLAQSTRSAPTDCRDGIRRIADLGPRASGYHPMADLIRSACECTFMTQNRRTV